MVVLLRRSWPNWQDELDGCDCHKIATVFSDGNEQGKTDLDTAAPGDDTWGRRAALVARALPLPRRRVGSRCRVPSLAAHTGASAAEKASLDGAIHPPAKHVGPAQGREEEDEEAR